MKTINMRPRDKKIAKNTAKTALLATAALAMAYAVTPSPPTAVATAATAMVQNRAFHEPMQTVVFVCLNTPNKPNQKFSRTLSTIISNRHWARR